MDLLHLATTAARQVAQWIRTVAAPRPEAWKAKGHSDFVTLVDQQAEAMLGEMLLAGAPGSRLVGEETAPTMHRDGLVWIVDPLDGTTNFLHGYPASAVSVAAAVDGVLEAGVVVRLEPDHCFTAARGQGAWLNGRPIRVSDITAPAHALLGTGIPFKQLEDLPRYLEDLARLIPTTSGIRRGGSAALDLADVAAGRLDGFWEMNLAPWDVAAGMLLVREAGGVVTDLDGVPREPGHGPVVAGNPAVHPWLLAQLQAGSGG